MFDYQSISFQRFGGVSRYIFDLASTFSIDNDVKVPVICPKSYYFESFFCRKSSKFALWRWSKLILFPLNKLYNILILILFKPDILHLSYYNSYILPFIPSNTCLVVTAHDMIHEIYPNFFPKWDFTSIHKRKTFKRANLIIAISENTKKDLIRFFNISPEKIKVIYHGNPIRNEINFNEVERLIENKYFLFVGQRDKYKNFNVLLKAIAPILIKTQFTLLCVGGKPFSNEEITQIDLLKISQWVKKKDCNEKQLISAYKNAICTIFPSEYEGFGFPILESWAMECPIILSNSSCFPEIAKDAALYFDAHNEIELRYNIERIILDENLRKTLVEKGKSYIAEYTIEKTTSQTLEAYFQAIEKFKFSII
ncbi:MAG: glycosyltransferase family 4 protein [Bacteroidales bacterium]